MDDDGAGATITAEELAGRLGTESAPVVIDVREPDEFAGWSIAGSRNIPLDELAARGGEIGDGRQVVVVCATGTRSKAAVARLGSAGIAATELLGGMAAWASVYDAATVDLGAVEVVQVRRRGKGCLSYLVGSGGEAFAVDPSAEAGRYLAEAERRGWRITRVFDTHLHADHVSGARALAATAGASLHLNPADAYEFDFEPLGDGDRFELGGAVLFEVTAVSTPGHTRGSTVYDVGGRAVLTGDTLFVDGVGRPDLAERAEEFARELHRSLHAKVLTLPADALVLPGHYGGTVEVRPSVPVAAPLGVLRRTLAPLSWDEEAFVGWAAHRATPRPPHYAEIIAVNIGRVTAGPEDCRRLEAGPNRCAA